MIYVYTVRNFAPIPMYGENKTPCALPTLRVLPHSDNYKTCTIYIYIYIYMYICALMKRLILVISERLTKMAENQEESVRLTEDMRL